MHVLDPTLALLLDLIGVFAFALSGALVAVRRQLDLVGVLLLAWLAGLGGGTVRDLLLGATPPVGVSDWRLVGTAVLAGLLTFASHVALHRVRRAIRVFDAVGLAFFCVTGSLKALTLGAGPLTAVIVGVVTAAGGGVMRDVVAGQVPEVLRRELYVLPALLGSCLTVLLHHLGVLGSLTVWIVVAAVFALRMASIALDWHAPYALTTGDDL
ncbi:trimeric intracellular cation channel family protein [Kytococcus aerolatus]|uniref:trimeric intracellular cation channel family protein n=1 Tax=Kytococcus aerolatus TaxID=592308 RepID=UPI001F334C47|nr:trimeric intracellular cation channel family protein [Kytococcus aerolatus]